MEHKECRRCARLYALTDENFYRHSGRQGGYDTICRSCKRERLESAQHTPSERRLLGMLQRATGLDKSLVHQQLNLQDNTCALTGVAFSMAWGDWNAPRLVASRGIFVCNALAAAIAACHGDARVCEVVGEALQRANIILRSEQSSDGGGSSRDADS